MTTVSLKPERKKKTVIDRLQVGQRIARKDSDTLGLVVAADEQVKVQWDDGATSYYRRGKPGNVRVVSLLPDQDVLRLGQI
jgi:hypothetical protein